MKKLVLILTALSVSSLAYAGAGCGGCAGGGKKPAEKPAEETKA